jgi:anaerobic magnesium-protoporphyrin IX monomethyl ester cyclase
MGKKVALVYPYFMTSALDHILFQPLGIAWLASQLRGIDIEARQFDCTFETFDGVVSEIVQYNPAVVGIYIMTTLSNNAMRILAALKQLLPGSLFVSGGPLPTLYPQRYSAEFDAVFCGEADISFPKFCADYIGGCMKKRDFLRGVDATAYPGIFFSRDGNNMSSVPVHWPEQILGVLPPADRSAVKNDLYKSAWMEKDGTKTASIMTTYGCPFNCDFCSRPVFGRALRKRPIEKIIEEIITIKELGYDRVWIGDDCFTLDKEFVRAFCGEFLKAAPDMKWTCLSRVDSVDEDMAVMMKRGGCDKVFLGLESGDNATLKLMNKKITVEDGISAVKTFVKSGIKTAGFFMVGYPGETKESVESTYRLALNLPLDEISFTVPYPLPGSPLYDRVKGVRADDDWDIENEVKLLFKSEFDGEWLKSGIENTMKAFRDNKKVSVS